MSEPAGVDLNLAVGVQLQASIDTLAGELRRYNDQQQKLNQQVNVFTIPGQPVSLTGSAGSLTGTLDMPQLMQPPSGDVWQMVGVSAWGFTTGSVDVYLNNTAGDLEFVFTSAGLWEPSDYYLTPGNRLVYSASGITGTVTIKHRYIRIAAEIMGPYLL